MSFPYVYEGISSPPGMRLFFVGTAVEHDNRRGSTSQQYASLAQEPCFLLPNEAVRHRQTFILEDLNREANDTVVGGAAMALVNNPTNGRSELYLTSCFVREKHRQKRLGSFMVGKLLTEYSLHAAPTRLHIKTDDQTPDSIDETLIGKGFRRNRTSPGAFSLNLPGRIITSFDGDRAKMQSEIATRKWNGLCGKRLYRDGEFLGSVGMERGNRPEDTSGGKGYVIRDTQGTEITCLKNDDSDIDWLLTGALYLLNRAAPERAL